MCWLVRKVMYPLLLEVATSGGSLPPELQLGCLDLFFLLAVILSIFTLLFLPSVSISYFILAIPMHAQVFGITRVDELHISYSHTEWNLLSTLSVNGDGICQQTSVNLNFELLLFYIFISLYF